jgi:predicted amidophosphoribosyltransferase
LAEKLALKKLQENMGSITHQEKQEEHGSRRLKGLGGNMVCVKHRNQSHHYVEGVCPKCGNPIRRKAPADLAFCLCSNPPVEVELFPVFYYEKNMVITHRQVKIKITYAEGV